MSVLRHSAWAAAAAIVLTGSRFAFLAIIASRLSLTDFGQYAYGQWLADITFLVCALGAPGAITRYAAESRHDPGLLAAIVRRWRPFALGLPWLAAALVPVAAWVSGLVLDTDALVMLSLWTMANASWAMQTAVLAGLQRFDLTFRASLTAALIFVVGAVLVPLDVHPLSRVFGLLAVASGCAALTGYAAARGSAAGDPSPIDLGRWRGIRQYALNIWVSGLLWSLVWSRGEMPLVRAYLGDDGVGRYAVALALFGGSIQGVMLAVSGVAPQLTRLWGERAYAQTHALARKIMDVQLIICGVSAILLTYFGPELIQIAFGSAYLDQAGSLAVLSLGLIAMTSSCQNHLLQLSTDGRFSRDATLAGLVVLFASATFLVSSLGVLGAALSRPTAMLFMTAVSLYFAHRTWGTSAYSPKNVGAVFLVVVLSVGVQAADLDLFWLYRAGLAAMAIGLVMVAVRDDAGRMQLGLVAARVQQVFRPALARSSGAGEP